MAKLIWVKGNLGPEPQYIRNEDALKTGLGRMKNDKVVIMEIDIPEPERHLDLGILARMYPCQR